KAGLVTLKVYDMLGKEVATLVNGTQAAGHYSVQFNASTLSSGVYIYRIQSNNFTAVKKLVLLK
ncbi:MAG: T9SS type A sorting domain-containing protein, partial [Ignavibacteriaceae bacterium]